MMNVPKYSNEVVVNLIREFISDVQRIHATGNATEHSYRPALHSLFTGFDVTALNEPKMENCGAPDFMILHDEIVIGHVEAKNLHVSIQNMKGNNKTQQERYRNALPNLIYTNALDWDFYRDGKLIASEKIAEFYKGVSPRPERYEALGNLLRNFIVQKPQTITTPSDLAKRMAGKANLIKDVLCYALTNKEPMESELAGQYQAFKENLIHDITEEEFADVYAETIAYGMFAARLHDTTLDSFSRQEALELLPKSNPFLRSLFTYIASQDIDERVVWIIDDLASVFEACDIAKIMENFGQLTGQSDPFLHFYETFLAAYNPNKRKARGVWYTPEPIVNFIVRAVDEVLQYEFDLPEGLADTSKVSIDWDTGQTDKKGKVITIKKNVHRVQILDPATGTGTFLAETMKQIAWRIQKDVPGMWSNYIEKDLIPRLHGLELLMASYAMCHMKLDMILTELGYKPTNDPPRLSVFLTNSLEEGEPANQFLPFAQWISQEARGANTIKRDLPIMCVIGNPPYSASSTNNSDWIMMEMQAYKKGLGERKVNLNDDYMKFIRLAEILIEKNQSGIVAMITNNSFLDGITQREMRHHLRKTFDKITILNLHGDIRTDDPTYGQDENVFDIMQGVSIIIMRKLRITNTDSLATIHYHEILGKRNAKYDALFQIGINDDSFSEIKCYEPLHRFLPNGISNEENYNLGFKISEFFGESSSGIQTKQDALCISPRKSDLSKRLDDFRNLDESSLRKKYRIPKDSRDWKMSMAIDDVLLGNGQIIPFLYKPFDVQNIYYTGRTKGFVAYPRRAIMQHIVGRENLCLIVNRQNVRDYFSYAFVTNIACCHGTFYLGNRGQDYCCPLYLYSTDTLRIEQSRRVNFDPTLYKQLQELVVQTGSEPPDELAVFDYIYGVLHCPAYRKVYSEFLKIDFPRIPWPSSPDEFWGVSNKGMELRKLHLMELEAIGPTKYPYIGEGDNIVEKPNFKDNKVWINKAQYFDNASEISWNLSIGGYNPAQKWLKDRMGKKLNYDDVKHYQRILKILSETDKIMRTISMEIDTT